jgi:hypothetical protein
MVRENLFVNKIPNHKHQITNKSQISIFNDQNILRNSIALFADLGPPLMMPLIKSEDGSFVWNFEFGSLEFV